MKIDEKSNKIARKILKENVLELAILQGFGAAAPMIRIKKLEC